MFITYKRGVFGMNIDLTEKVQSRKILSPDEKEMVKRLFSFYKEVISISDKVTVEHKNAIEDKFNEYEKDVSEIEMNDTKELNMTI